MPDGKLLIHNNKLYNAGSTICNIATIVYTGDGKKDRVVSLGQTPLCVIVTHKSNAFFYPAPNGVNRYSYSGICSQSFVPMMLDNSGRIVNIVDSGFEVHYNEPSGSVYVRTNEINQKYLAIIFFA